MYVGGWKKAIHEGVIGMLIKNLTLCVTVSWSARVVSRSLVVSAHRVVVVPKIEISCQSAAAVHEFWSRYAR
jgi:hypothetical protein